MFNTGTQRRGSLTGESPAIPSQRRASVPQGPGSCLPPNLLRKGSKLTFMGAGRRVSMMMNYRHGMQRARGKGLDGEAEDPNPMEPIRELPHSPRFSTFLSPEAQYAMLKGYEDKLYNRITDSKPEVRSSLQRSKTPFRKISIVDSDNRKLREVVEEQGEEGNRGQGPGVKSPRTTIPSSGHGISMQTIQSTSSNAVRSMDSNRTLSPVPTPTPTITPSSASISVPYLKPLRRQSVAGSSPMVELNGNKMMLVTSSMSPLDSPMENLHLQRSYSLPTLDPPGGPLSMRKRLVLTYRLESAMDMLDSLKSTLPVKVEGQDGEEKSEGQSLSPRVLKGQSCLPQGGDPVKDFNCWSRVCSLSSQHLVCF